MTLAALSAVGRGAPCQLPMGADTLEPWREGREDSQVVLDVGPEQVLAKQTQQKHPISLGGRGVPSVRTAMIGRRGEVEAGKASGTLGSPAPRLER